jgi:hypothetical protein
MTGNTELINKYDVTAVINENGTVDIKEQIEYNFGNLQRHGIFRKIK